jgi:hypothetical protein
MPKRDGTGVSGQRPGTGRGRGQRIQSGRGRGGGYFAGPGGNCVCPKCGAKITHELGTPCYEQHCPKCGEVMTRE